MPESVQTHRVPGEDFHRPASAGIPEVWIVDQFGGAIAVSRNPSPKGYRSKAPVRRGERLQVSALPAGDVAVNDIIPV
jgi:Uma2 family endonuclease